MIVQIAIMLFGGAAIWFVGRKEKWSRWGYILGLLGQPFWIYESYTNEQWGIWLMTTVYTYSWIQGIINYWIFPKEKTPLSPENLKPNMQQKNCKHQWKIGNIRSLMPYARCKKCGKRTYTDD